MGWIVAIFSRPVSTSTVQLPELTVADRVITVFVLGSFTLATVNGLIVVAGKALP
jgi:hypothetical protein